MLQAGARSIWHRDIAEAGQLAAQPGRRPPPRPRGASAARDSQPWAEARPRELPDQEHERQLSPATSISCPAASGGGRQHLLPQHLPAATAPRELQGEPPQEGAGGWRQLSKGIQGPQQLRETAAP